jgi:hypothetical protein
VPALQAVFQVVAQARVEKIGMLMDVHRLAARADLAAVTGRPTLLFANRMDAHPLRYFGYRAILPRPVFPGPGAVPVMRGGRVVGGYSSNLSSNAGGMKIEVNGKKLSRADIVTAHAVQAEYLEQHADVP